MKITVFNPKSNKEKSFFGQVIKQSPLHTFIKLSEDCGALKAGNTKILKTDWIR
jgi:hypothetical protein